MLSVKHQYFADCILDGMTATDAAIEAGYSEKTAYSSGSRLAQDPAVMEYIASKRQKIEKKVDVSRERVMAEYAKLAFYDPRSIHNEDGTVKAIPDWNDDAAAALCGFEIKEEKAYATYEGDDIAKGDFAKATERSGELKKFKMEQRKGALDSLCRMLGYDAPKKLEVAGAEGGPIQVAHLSAEEAKIISKFLENDVWPKRK